MVKATKINGKNGLKYEKNQNSNRARANGDGKTFGKMGSIILTVATFIAMGYNVWTVE